MQSLPRRKSPRLKEYDYRQAGAYFVTICTVKRLELFGTINDGVMALSPLGQIASEELLSLPARWQSIDLDACVVMPNHVHAIIVIEADAQDGKNAVPTDGSAADAKNRVPTDPSATPSLGSIVGNYKAGVTRFARSANLIDDAQSIWQTRYHDHIIRSEGSLNHIRAYVEQNPARWSEDTFYSVV
ncbi:MAG TPA: hypothetical protein PLQ56_23075 [Aggregatilineales bacterium]|nr:hypothetical protein [Aggregatilineales bacterium]